MYIVTERYDAYLYILLRIIVIEIEIEKRKFEFPFNFQSLQFATVFTFCSVEGISFLSNVTLFFLLGSFAIENDTMPNYSKKKKENMS